MVTTEVLSLKMTAYKKCGKRTENLEQLYHVLFNLPSTSISCESVQCLASPVLLLPKEEPG